MLGLISLVIDDVTDEGERILMSARTPEGTVTCPGCAAEAGRVHASHQRIFADLLVDARPVVARVRVRRLACPTGGLRVPQTSSVLLRGRLDHEDEVTDALTSAFLDASVIDVCVLREDDQLCSFNWPTSV